MDAGHTTAAGEQLRPSGARPGRSVPPVAATWSPDFLPQIVLARPADARGLSGANEDDFFGSVLPLPEAEAQLVAATVLYEVVPALARRDRTGFVTGLTRFQELGFKHREWEAQPTSVHDLHKFALSQGAAATMLSSMGPTLAVFTDDPAGMARVMGQRDLTHVTLSSFARAGVRVRGDHG
jgi:beta-RFAP synthase